MIFTMKEALFGDKTPDLMSGEAVAEADYNAQNGIKDGGEDSLLAVRKDVHLALVVYAPKGVRTSGTYVYPFQDKDGQVSAFKIGDRCETDYDYAVTVATRLHFLEKLGVPLLPILVKFQESQNKSLGDYLNERRDIKEKALYTYRKESAKLTINDIRYDSSLWYEPAKPTDKGIDLKSILNTTASLSLGRLKPVEEYDGQGFLKFLGKKGDVLVDFANLKPDFFAKLADALKMGSMALLGNSTFCEEVSTGQNQPDKIFISREENEKYVFLVVERDLSLAEAYRLFYFLTKDQVGLLMSGCRHLAELSAS